MKIAIIGSKNLTVQNLEKYLPLGVTEIVSGGVKGIDACAKECAHRTVLKLTEFLCLSTKSMDAVRRCGEIWKSLLMLMR